MHISPVKLDFNKDSFNIISKERDLGICTEQNAITPESKARPDVLFQVRNLGTMRAVSEARNSHSIQDDSLLRLHMNLFRLRVNSDFINPYFVLLIFVSTRKHLFLLFLQYKRVFLLNVELMGLKVYIGHYILKITFSLRSAILLRLIYFSSPFNLLYIAFRKARHFQRQSLSITTP